MKSKNSLPTIHKADLVKIHSVTPPRIHPMKLKRIKA